METTKPTDLEHKITEAARELFIENGYAETSMSDIAAHVGINRPTLHYYFRTKDRLFNAVFGSIIERLAPQVQDIVRQRGVSVSKRSEMVIDTYYRMFKANPSLPMFMLREMKRDYTFVFNIARSMHFDAYFDNIRAEIQAQMDEGLIKQVPMRFVFLTFYSILAMPFAMKPVCENIMLYESETFDDMLNKWKKQMSTTISKMLDMES